MEKNKSLNPFLIIFVSCELLFYLLIVQTGLLEFYNDDIFFLIWLPIGGIIGSILSGYIALDLWKKSLLFLSFQLFGALFYPYLGNFTQFIMGLGVGAMAPIVIRVLGNGKKVDLSISILIAYVFGTLLFNYPPQNRYFLAIFLTIIPIICLIYLNLKNPLYKNDFTKINEFGMIFLMFIWVFLDSSLFETLSRSESISLWRGEYYIFLVISHIIGVVYAIKSTQTINKEGFIIFCMFMISYLAYFLQLPLILALIYPATVSLYNVVILEYLRVHYSFKMVGIYMVFLGWMASGFGLLVSLYEVIIISVFILAILGYFYYLNMNKNSY